MTGDAPTPPATRATDARDAALTALDEANGLEGPVEEAQAEQRAVEEFVEEVATAVSDGYSATQAKQLCGVVSDVANHYTKTALKETLAEAIERIDVEQSDRRQFDAILNDDLQEVVIVRTTDAKQETKYRWEFTDGSVETHADSEGRAHFSWNVFRNEYFDAIGEDATKPDQDLRDGEAWREFIVEKIEAKGREVTTRGPRTAAVEQLADFISRSRAYNDLGDAVERDALYLDADPREEEPEELWVLNHDIKRICEDNELGTVRELQIELDARGHTVDRVAGVSESTTLDGKNVTYWVLSAGFAEPAEFIPEAVDPAEGFQQDQARADGGDKPDDDDDYEPGAIGAVGGDSDD